MASIPPDSPFDTEELKHLALKAMRSDRDDDAIRWLKAAIGQAPEDGELLYLLGMVHSHLGMVERAIGEIEEALRLTPRLINARFQLGLLHFTNRRFEASEAAWQPLLETLPPQEPLHLFASGMVKVGRDDLAEALVLLEQGLAVGRNPTLNADMARIADEVRRQMARMAAQPAGADPSPPHVLLSGYAKAGTVN